MQSTRPKNGATPLAFAALIAGNVALATGPMLVRMADTSPTTSALWRLVIAAPFLMVIALWQSGPASFAPMRKLWPLLALAGLAFAGDLASWHSGIVRTTLANSTLFGNCTILIFPLYGFVMARRLPSKGQAATLLLAAAGGALLLGRSAELSPRHLLGDLFCLIAGLLYTVYLITLARVRKDVPPLPTLAVATLAAIPALGVLTVASGAPLFPPHLLPLLALALVSQVIGQGLTVYALGRFSPLVMGIALLTQPIVATAIGWIGYGERLAPLDWIGAGLVAAALVMVRSGDGKADEDQLASAVEEAQEKGHD
jgi:drug/metabolite transporter (DMT)-like permease